MCEFASLKLIMHNHKYKHAWALWIKSKGVVKNCVLVTPFVKCPQEAVCMYHYKLLKFYSSSLQSHIQLTCLTPATVATHFLSFFRLFWDACRCTILISVAPFTTTINSKITVVTENLFRHHSSSLPLNTHIINKKQPKL